MVGNGSGRNHIDSSSDWGCLARSEAQPATPNRALIVRSNSGLKPQEYFGLLLGITVVPSFRLIYKLQLQIQNLHRARDLPLRLLLGDAQILPRA